MRLPDEMTYGESLGPAMQITDQVEADEYLAALIERHIRITGDSDAEARRVQMVNLGYYAGYYDSETAERVRRLYGAAHPIFGAQRPSADRALAAGMALGNLAAATKDATVKVEAFGRAWQAAERVLADGSPDD